jgi:hypothetical protein
MILGKYPVPSCAHAQLVIEVEALDGAVKTRVQCNVQGTPVFLAFSITHPYMRHQYNAHILR